MRQTAPKIAVPHHMNSATQLDAVPNKHEPPKCQIKKLHFKELKQVQSEANNAKIAVPHPHEQCHT